MRDMFAPYLFLSASLLVAKFQDELLLILQDSIGFKISDFTFGKVEQLKLKTQKEQVYTGSPRLVRSPD